MHDFAHGRLIANGSVHQAGLFQIKVKGSMLKSKSSDVPFQFDRTNRLCTTFCSVARNRIEPLQHTINCPDHFSTIHRFPFHLSFVTKRMHGKALGQSLPLSIRSMIAFHKDKGRFDFVGLYIKQSETHFAHPSLPTQINSTIPRNHGQSVVSNPLSAINLITICFHRRGAKRSAIVVTFRRGRPTRASDEPHLTLSFIVFIGCRVWEESDFPVHLGDQVVHV